MIDLRRFVERVGERLEATAARSPRTHASAPRINAYHGYANASEAFVFGRILRNAPVATADAADPWWRNFLNTYRRMETDETPGIRLRIELGSRTVESVSDGEGHFRARIQLPGPLPADRRWHEARIELVAPSGHRWQSVTASAPVLLPARTAAFAVLSDVDDTVIRTGATRPIRMLRKVLFENARTREPFELVPEFYTALEKGTGDHEANPFFYLSSSPWNLHDVLVDFLEHNGIPVGPLLLKDWGLPDRSAPRPTHREHKLARIEHLLGVYPGLPFILIGDNGQEDPAIYAETVERNPGRILGVYVRETEPDDRRAESVARFGEAIEGRGAAFHAFSDTRSALAHAAARGWITAQAAAAASGQA